MTTAALLTALRGVARLGRVFDAQLCQIASAAGLVVHPALPAFPLQTPACALAALRACARSGGALPCREPPPAPLKRRRCGSSVVACVQVAARAEAVSRCARRAQAAAASPCCDGAPAALLARLRALLARLRAPLVRLRARSLRLRALLLRLLAL